MSKRLTTTSSSPDRRKALFRRVPSIERILSRPAIHSLASTFGRQAVTDATRTLCAELKRAVTEGLTEEELEERIGALDEAVGEKLREEIRASLRPAINATGIIVHTNLGRAPLSDRAVDAISEIARGYTNLELDLETGKRGSRHQHASHLLSRLFPGKSALVVNNAAAAVMLSLNTFAASKEVVISRGELVEIGGSFRVPDILVRSGARLREVGTTNKTRIADYEQAIGPETGVLLRVHPSNFRIVGFTESASTEEIAKLGRERGLTVIEDFGSGNLLSLAPFSLPREPTVAQSLASGVHISIFSGDKLLGGPQAGILVGDHAAIETCRKNPMARALRVDKLTYAALEATLLSFVEGKATREIPVLRMLSAPQSAIRERSERFIAALGDTGQLELAIEATTSRIGGGAAVDAEIATYAITIVDPSTPAQKIVTALRAHRPPVIARIVDGRVLIDLRTVAEQDEDALRAALISIQDDAS